MNTRNGTGMNQGAGGPGGNLDERLDSIKESVKGLVDRGEERVGAIRNRVMDAKDKAMTRGNDVLEQVTTFIKANPLKAVGIAFGAGYIGMRLFRR